MKSFMHTAANNVMLLTNIISLFHLDNGKLMMHHLSKFFKIQFLGSQKVNAISSEEFFRIILREMDLS